MDRQEQNGRWYVCKVLLRAGILLKLKSWQIFLVSADSVQLIFHCDISFLPLLLLFSLLEPPEAYIDNKHDEKDTTGCQLGIGGAGIQILGITPVLLWQGRQVAGLGVERCREEKPEEREQEFKTKQERGEWKGRREKHRWLQNVTQKHYSKKSYSVIHHFDLKRSVQAWSNSNSPERASPLCSTSSMLATMILCTSWSSVLMLPRFLLARLSM